MWKIETSMEVSEKGGRSQIVGRKVKEEEKKKEYF